MQRCYAPQTTQNELRARLPAKAWRLACLSQGIQGELVLQHTNGASVHVFGVTHRQRQVPSHAFMTPESGPSPAQP